MAQPPPRTDEEIARAAVHDIAGNVTGREPWREYDQRYVFQRILRAIREAKAAAALGCFLIPLAAQAQSSFPRCIGPDQQNPGWVHDGPCKVTDIGFIVSRRTVHFFSNASPIRRSAM